MEVTVAGQELKKFLEKDIDFVALKDKQGNMQVNDRFYRFIEAEEGLRLVAYDDARPNHALMSGDRVIGTLTIGYGHTGSDVRIGQIITREEANDMLARDVAWAVAVVNQRVKVPLTQNQFNALVSFVFNIGETQFKKSTLLKLLNGDHNNDGVLESPPDYYSVPTQLRRWIFSADGPVLANRREREVALWMERDDEPGHVDQRSV